MGRLPQPHAIPPKDDKLSPRKTGRQQKQLTQLPQLEKTSYVTTCSCHHSTNTSQSVNTTNMADLKRILLPRIKCIRTVHPPICIWKPRCWLCTNTVNRASAKKSRLKVVQRRTNLRATNAELKRLREETENEFTRLSVKNHDLKAKIISHFNRCPPCGTRYAEVAVTSYRRYREGKRK